MKIIKFTLVAVVCSLGTIKSHAYTGISPYAYCANNPVMFVDPNGKEYVFTLATPMQIQKNRQLTAEQKVRMTNSYMNLTTNISKRTSLGIENVFELFAHGTPNAVLSRFTYIDNPEKLYQVFTGNSKYLSLQNSNSSVFILYSCSTGKGDNSIAQQFSGINEVSGSLVIAPTDVVSIDQKGDEYVKNNGGWNVFYKGEKISTISGEQGAMTKFVQDKLSDLKGYLKQCEQQYNNLDER